MPPTTAHKLRRLTKLLAAFAVTMFCVAMAGAVYGHPFSWDVKRSVGQWIVNVLVYVAVAAGGLYAKKQPNGAPIAAGIWIALGVAILLTGICATG